MAFYNNQEDENELQDGQPGAPSGQSASLQGGAPGAQSGGGSRPDNPGNFVGITDYLKANQNQAGKLGDQVGGKITSSISDANTGLNNAGSQFNQAASQGVIQGLGTASQDATGIVNRADTSGKLNEGDATRFNQISNASYSGPKNLADKQEIYQPAFKAYNDAQRLASLSENESGSQELVKDFANKDKNYTKGANRLDSYLLNTQDNRNKLLSARDSAKDLAPKLKQTEDSASAFATGLSNQSNQAKATARDLLASTSMARRAATDSRLNSLKSLVDKKNSNISELTQVFGDQSDGGSASFTPEQLNLLGLSDNQQLFGALNTGASDLLPQLNPFDANTAISKEEQSRMASLAELSNQYGGGFSNPYTMGDLAGTGVYDTGFDNSKLQSKVAAGKKTYDDAFDNNKYFVPFGAPGVNAPGDYSATMKQLHDGIIPYWQGQGARGQSIAAGLAKTIEDFKKDFKYNDRAKKK